MQKLTGSKYFLVVLIFQWWTLSLILSSLHTQRTTSTELAVRHVQDVEIDHARHSIRRRINPTDRSRDGKKMDLWPTDKEEVALLHERGEEAGRLAATEPREEGAKNGHRKRRKGDRDDRDVRDRDDDVVQAGIPTKKRKSKR